MKNLSEVRRNIRAIVDDSQTKVAASERQPLGIKQIRKLSDVLAATRKRQKGHPLKSHAEVVALLKKGWMIRVVSWIRVRAVLRPGGSSIANMIELLIRDYYGRNGITIQGQQALSLADDGTAQAMIR